MAISSPLSSLESTAKDTSKKTVSISRVLSRSIGNKKNLSQSKSLFRKRRIEFGKRSSLRDRFLVPNIVVRPKGPRTLALADTSTSVTSRLLGFVGYLSAGWILSNMPTWIALGKQFTTRLITAGGILRNYGDESVRVMNGLASVFGAALENISRFDFTDSSYLVRSSLNDLRGEIDALGDGLQESFAVLLKPFKDIPELGTIQPDEPTLPPGNNEGKFSGSGYTKATQIAKRLQKDLGLSDYQAAAVAGNLLQENTTLGSDIIEGGQRGLLSEAIKRGTGYGWAQWTDPGRQRKLYRLAQSMGIDPSKQPLTDEVNYAMLINELPQYDSSGRFRSSKNIQQSSNWLLRNYFNPQDQGVREQNERISDSKTILKSITSTVPPVAKQTPTQPQVTGQRRLQKNDIFTKSLGKDVDFIQVTSLVGDPRSHGPHGGIDIAAPSGTYIALRVDAEWVAYDYQSGGYGHVLDLWIPSYGIQLRFAHLLEQPARLSKISAGTSFARVGSSGGSRGPHIHLEYDTKKGPRGGGALNDDPANYAANLDQYVRLLLLTKNPNKGRFSPAPKPSTTLVPVPLSIQSSESQDQVEIETNSYLAGLLNGITQERQGRKILIIDDRGSAITQQIISSSGEDIQIQIPESALLNNFIKKKLLLDLNYV